MKERIIILYRFVLNLEKDLDVSNPNTIEYFKYLRRQYRLHFIFMSKSAREKFQKRLNNISKIIYENIKN